MDYLKFEHFAQDLSVAGLRRYRESNSWWEPWTKKDADKGQVGKVSFRDVMMAWQLYTNAFSSKAGIVLGDERLRRDKSLLDSFGAANASGEVQEKEQKELIEKLRKERLLLRVMEALGVVTPPVMGPGGVLSDKYWSPLLNDCLILAGVHSGHTFYFAHDDFDKFQEKFQGVSEKQAMFQAKPDPKTASPPGRPNTAPARARDWRAVWLNFFLASTNNIPNTNQFWSEGGDFPRIFARELVGLYAFGYTPDFSRIQLSFSRSSKVQGDFRAYLNAIDASGITTKNKTTLFETVSKFLFGNAQALVVPTKIPKRPAAPAGRP